MGVLVVAAVIDAVVVCALAAVPLVKAGQVVVLYALLALQFSAAAFYEPGEPASQGLGCHRPCCTHGGGAASTASQGLHCVEASQPVPRPASGHLPPHCALLCRAARLPGPPSAARKALVPVLVPADQLHLATTIDR